MTIKKTGAWLARYALEQLPIHFVFGIPGVHNTELFDELNSSDRLEPVLVTHEVCAAFMADGVSRTSQQIGCLLVVPAAGITHAASGIGEAFLDGIPMLVISGGIRTDSQFHYQLHDVEQHQILKPITKKTFKIESHELIIPTIFEAYALAMDGEPGPVYIEIPVNLQLDRGTVSHLPTFSSLTTQSNVEMQKLEQVISLLERANKPAMFVGWGAREAREFLINIAEHLAMPVATTLQGLSVFPAEHPLHAGFGFGPAATPSAQNAFQNCDCLLAIGTRFSEIATGSFGINVPDDLIHIDINPLVFNRNYPAKIAIQGDAKTVLEKLNEKIKFGLDVRPSQKLETQIAADKLKYRQEWLAADCSEKVNPIRFFDELKTIMSDNAMLVVDDGNHTFLTAELMPITCQNGFISPTDFNCMGYAIPAAIGVKLSHPERQVISIVGDGAFLMTGLELATAVARRAATINFVFNDGELSQIAQAQMKPYNRKTCTTLAKVNLQGIAMATGCHYLSITNNQQLAATIAEAFNQAESGVAVIVDVNIDYNKPTCFTQGAVKSNLKRLNIETKVRMIGRAIYRKLMD